MKIFKILYALLALALVACYEPIPPAVVPDTSVASLGTPENNEIWFTTTDGLDLTGLDGEAFGVAIEEIIFSEFGINTIRFAGRVTTVGEGAFRNCRNLFNISLPNSVTTIGARAFYDCTNMECITLGNGLVECGREAFDNCISLNSLYIAGIASWCKIEFANPTANPLYYAQRFIVNGKKPLNIAIPSSCESIGSYSFYGYGTLAEVQIPATLTRIGKYAFEECSNLKKVVVEDINAWCGIEFENERANPLSVAGALYKDGAVVSALSLEGVERVRERAFLNCTTITSLLSDEALQHIELEAFRNCTALKTVSLSTSVKEIGARGFMGCLTLKSVNVMATEPPVLGDNYVFDYNAEGRKIYIPSAAYEAYVADALWGEYAESFEKR